MKAGANILDKLRKLHLSRPSKRRLLLGLLTISALLLGFALQAYQKREQDRGIQAERSASWRSPIKPAAASASAALSLEADSALRLASELVAREHQGPSLQRAQLRRAAGGRFELKGE